MSVRNYTDIGFKKIRAPEEMFNALKEFWKANRHMEETEFYAINTYYNFWESPPFGIDVFDADLIGGGDHLGKMVADALQEVLENWTGQKLVLRSTFGIRIYKNNTILVRCGRWFAAASLIDLSNSNENVCRRLMWIASR
jgi:hypothetical protein